MIIYNKVEEYTFEVYEHNCKECGSDCDCGCVPSEKDRDTRFILSCTTCSVCVEEKGQKQ